MKFSPYNQRKLKLQTMYERTISEGGDAMELSGVMLHARVLIFCLFFMGVRKNIFVFPEYIITLRARIAIPRSDAHFTSKVKSHWSEGSDQWEIFSDELCGT